MNGRREDGRPIRVMHLRQAAGGGGGADEVILNLMNHADPRRIEVRAVFLRHHRQDLATLATRFDEGGLAFSECPGGRFFDRRQLGAVTEAVRKTGADIVHCHDPKSDIYGLLLKKANRSLKTVSTIHGWIEKSWKVRLYNRIDRAAMGRFDALIAVSAALAAEAGRRGLPGTLVVPNGVEVEFWAGGGAGGPGEAGAFTVGFVGRLSPEKGCGDLLRVAAGVAGGGFRFLVAGEGPEEEGLRKKVRSGNLSDRVSFLGYLGRRELRDFYGRIDVLLLPSLSEGMPMAVLEAAAAGVPAIATDVGGVGEVISDGVSGLLVAPGDVAAMAEGLKRLRREGALRRRLAAAARRMVTERFSAEAMAQRTADIYARLLGREGMGK